MCALGPCLAGELARRERRGDGEQARRLNEVHARPGALSGRWLSEMFTDVQRCSRNAPREPNKPTVFTILLH